MKTFPLYCGNCMTLMRLPLAGAETRSACPACGAELEAHVFPAAFRLVRGRWPEPLVAEGEAGCFYHANQRAEVHCQSCGRFLCALCDVEFEGKHLCPLCIEAGIQSGAMKHLRTSAINYDSLAFAIALFPIITVYFTVFTAPLALFVAIWGWKKHESLTPRNRSRFVAAILLASAQIAAWGIGLVMLLQGLFQ
jgi:hypothetical protein